MRRKEAIDRRASDAHQPCPAVRRRSSDFFCRRTSGATDLVAGFLAMAEEEGRRRGCTRAVLSTLHFQAPGFYLKQGWEVAARIDCEPPGHTRFYMTKKLY
jgi:hypothetical protein